jgi:hypothetical protein
VLRPQQVELLAKLSADAAEGRSVCHQMLMGEGKTTVISPLLALLLGNDSLVIQIVPAQLLAFALSVLRACFGGAGALRKPTWTFAFDRRQPITAELVNKVQTAVLEHAVVLGTPAAFKAFMLKFAELLHLLDSGQFPRNLSKLGRAARAAAGAARSAGRAMRGRARQKSITSRPALKQVFDKNALRQQAKWAAQVLEVWRGAVAVIDEVDVVLHPLRSELNWPLGDKNPLDFAPKRWEVPAHLIEAVLIVQEGLHALASGPDAATPEGEGAAADGGTAGAAGAVTSAVSALPAKDQEVLRRLKLAVRAGLQSSETQPSLNLPLTLHPETLPSGARWAGVQEPAVRTAPGASIQRVLPVGAAPAAHRVVAALAAAAGAAGRDR